MFLHINPHILIISVIFINGINLYVLKNIPFISSIPLSVIKYLILLYLKYKYAKQKIEKNKVNINPSLKNL